MNYYTGTSSTGRVHATRSDSHLPVAFSLCGVSLSKNYESENVQSIARTFFQQYVAGSQPIDCAKCEDKIRKETQ